MARWRMSAGRLAEIRELGKPGNLANATFVVELLAEVDALRADSQDTDQRGREERGFAIRITDWREGAESFRATTRAPSGWAQAQIAGVLGGATKDGPWCEGFGPTPHDSVGDLERQLGRALIAAIAKGIPPY